jgi:hypothetical protein
VTDIIAAKRAFVPQLRGNPHARGVAVGFRTKNGHTTNELAIVVLVDRKRPLVEMERQFVIQRRFGAYPIDVVEGSFDIKPLSGEVDKPGLGELVRPLKGGTLLSSFQLTQHQGAVQASPARKSLRSVSGKEPSSTSRSGVA